MLCVIRLALRPGRLGSLVSALLLVLALAACGDDEGPVYIEQPVEQLYNRALNALYLKNYEESARLFDEVERQHPYSAWASKAQLMAAFVQYQDSKYDDAINTLDRFIQLHPGHKDIAYAYYLRGISYYEQISDVERDQRMTRRALANLDEVSRRFPDSKYARDSRFKMDLTRDHLAGKHMSIGRFYLSGGEYLAAINRFRIVIKNFQTTTHVPEALHRLVEAYLAIGVVDEAQANAAVLGYNYPGSEWYADSYALLTGVDVMPDEEADQGWASRAWDSVF
jgi:outer membrane protein assembly factor BamD